MNKRSKLQFQSVILLEALTNHFKIYAEELEGDDALLKPVFDELVEQKLVLLDDGLYSATELGTEVAKRFLARKQDFEKSFKVFSHVDLETADFAWGLSVEEFDNIEEILDEDRWLDLRTAVAEHKGMNLLETNFFMYLTDYPSDERLQLAGAVDDWQAQFMDEKLWNGITRYQKNSLKVEDLTFEDDEGVVPGSETIVDIIACGAQINISTHENATKGTAFDFHDDFGLTAPAAMLTKTVRNYLKAPYVAPCWLTDIVTGKRVRKAPEYYW